MDAKEHRSQLEQAIRINRLQNIAIIALAMTNLYFGFHALKGAFDTRTIITPPVIHENFWIEGDKVSSSYLKEMAYYYLNLVMNVTPHTVDFQTDTFLKYVDSSYYPNLKTRMKVTANRIKRDNVSTVFFAKRLDVDPLTRRVIATGHLSTFIGQTKQSEASHRYLIEFTHGGTRLLVKKLCETDPKGQRCMGDHNEKLAAN